MSDTPARPGSLFGQIFDWLLSPMVVIWPTIIVGAYVTTTSLTDAPFDKELETLVLAVAEDARSPRAGRSGDEAFPALHALRAMPGERLFVQLATLGGEVLAGDFAIPPPRARDPQGPGKVHFRQALVDEAPARIAYLVLGEEAQVPGRLIQVAEPVERRRVLASEATRVMAVFMIVLLPLLVVLVWIGLRHGLRPVRDLGARIAARSAGDASPIPVSDVPEELSSLVESVNIQLGRVRANLEAQRRFVGEAAHQLRTPLAGLKVQAQVALRELTEPAARQRLLRIEESLNRMEHLVTQLLALARADDARTRAQPFEPVDLDTLVHEVCTQAADAAIARRTTIAFDRSGARALVQGTPFLLHQLFANLVDNAVRYSPPGSEVSVRVSAGENCAVAVEDAGPGIPPEERELVFERFYRALGTGEAGSGLGLAIAREIALLHAATIRIESPAAGGTRFVVQFPPPGKP